MSHETIIAALNGLSKTRVYHISPENQALHITVESDRSAIILNGSTVEHFLTAKLEDKMPSLNSDERTKMFSPEGPLGTFANKNRIAFGLGVMERAVSKKIDVIRAMRNAAAHCIKLVTFTTTEFRDGVQQLADPKHRSQIAVFNSRQLRHFFSLVCIDICQLIDHGEPLQSDQERIDMVLSGLQQSASHDKPAE